MRRYQKNIVSQYFLAGVLTLAAFALHSEEPRADQVSTTTKPERSCTDYVPAYSHIYLSKDQTTSLGITLSIRNVDSTKKISVSRVEYYDTHGVLTDVLADKSFTLGPMATVSYVIDQQDMRGGVGANFIVRWSGDKQIHPPITEAVMVGSSGTKGYSFSSRGENIACDD
ncbi:DUF3124 domain-containing protein [Methylomonas methanica]|uniref:DUF3124 domain-containing protein n=1 Tax=Methylomonas methanica (strain DSM 25384 / MC09) TaxID=857087 RepID=F9ZVG6_METMM|nr:DUF3124 domain-containing protein [Methylomonas methanica]AEG01948.1 hypothetical protein Metme_3584 [Methylomonas methanica MC09]